MQKPACRNSRLSWWQARGAAASEPEYWWTADWFPKMGRHVGPACTRHLRLSVPGSRAKPRRHRLGRFRPTRKKNEARRPGLPTVRRSEGGLPRHASTFAAEEQHGPRAFLRRRELHRLT